MKNLTEQIPCYQHAWQSSPSPAAIEGLAVQRWRCRYPAAGVPGGVGTHRRASAGWTGLSNARVDAARGAQHGAAMIAEGLKVVCVQRVDDHIVESALGRPARRPNPRPPRDFGNSVDHEKSVRPFKGIFCRDISEFESYMPSHAVGLSVWSTTCGGAFNSCPLSSELHEGRASANIDTNPKVR